MSAPKDDGNSAFPYQACGRDGLPVDEQWPGMSLRDWFAGQALAGALANPAMNPPSLQAEAEGAYALADAMMKARKAHS